MSAVPADLPQESQLDPERILRVLPERERATFLDEYERAINEARDPAGWKHLNRLLRLWAMRAIAVSEPGYYEARDRARVVGGEGMLLTRPRTTVAVPFVLEKDLAAAVTAPYPKASRSASARSTD